MRAPVISTVMMATHKMSGQIARALTETRYAYTHSQSAQVVQKGVHRGVPINRSFVVGPSNAGARPGCAPKSAWYRERKWPASTVGAKDTPLPPLAAAAEADASGAPAYPCMRGGARVPGGGGM